MTCTLRQLGLALPLVFVASWFATNQLLAVEPQWIWNDAAAVNKAPAGDVLFRKAFDLETPSSGTLEIAADNYFELFVNGRRVGKGGGWNPRQRFIISPLLTPGRNLLAIRATNDGADNPAGLMVRLNIEQKDKPPVEVVTSGEWKTAAQAVGPWHRMEFDDSAWKTAVALGEYGKTGPWGAPGAIIDEQSAISVKTRSTESGIFELRDNDRVVFLGGTFFEREQFYGYLEHALIAGAPSKNIVVRNLGWSGDNVWGDARAVFGQRADGFKRLISDVQLCEPTVVVVHYGENEAYAGSTGLSEFQAGLDTLLDALEATGARIVLLGPRRHEPRKGLKAPEDYNANLATYSAAIAATAQTRGHWFFDMAADAENEPLTENGIHLSAFGYWRLAGNFAERLGATKPAGEIEIDLSSKILDATGVEVSDLMPTATGITFSAKRRVLPLPSVPLEWQTAGESSRTAPRSAAPRWTGKVDTAKAGFKVKIRGLPPGTYRLLADGKEVDGTTHDKWAAGVTLPRSPDADQSEQLRNVLIEKNFAFFNRYRPQNETYLFLFRKHEQGNNAVEIPQFDPLVTEYETQITTLRKATSQKWELRRIEN
jgi:lysophospholipase L1-like esterase